MGGGVGDHGIDQPLLPVEVTKTDAADAVQQKAPGNDGSGPADGLSGERQVSGSKEKSRQKDSAPVDPAGYGWILSGRGKLPDYQNQKR